MALSQSKVIILEESETDELNVKVERIKREVRLSNRLRDNKVAENTGSRQQRDSPLIFLVQLFGDRSDEKGPLGARL
jgi:hypothetical protein